MLASANADCIIAPVFFDNRDNLVVTGTSWGPIWKKFTTCKGPDGSSGAHGSDEGSTYDDGEHIYLKAGHTCEKVFCNLKTGGNVSKYRYFKCDEEVANQIEVQHWWKGIFTFQVSSMPIFEIFGLF